jgi:hypothetical protein
MLLQFHPYLKIRGRFIIKGENVCLEEGRKSREELFCGAMVCCIVCIGGIKDKLARQI